MAPFDIPLWWTLFWSTQYSDVTWRAIVFVFSDLIKLLVYYDGGSDLVQQSKSICDIIIAGRPLAGVRGIARGTGIVAHCPLPVFPERILFMLPCRSSTPVLFTDVSQGSLGLGHIPAPPAVSKGSLSRIKLTLNRTVE